MKTKNKKALLAVFLYILLQLLNYSYGSIFTEILIYIIDSNVDKYCSMFFDIPKKSEVNNGGFWLVPIFSFIHQKFMLNDAPFWASHSTKCGKMGLDKAL